MSHGPVEARGSASTVGGAGLAAERLRLINGASFRMVVDVGDWDKSRVINTPGQSGDPFSPQYRDLFPCGTAANMCRCCIRGRRWTRRRGW